MATYQDRLENLVQLDKEERDALQGELEEALDKADKADDVEAMEELLLGMKQIQNYNRLVDQVNAAAPADVADDAPVEQPSVDTVESVSAEVVADPVPEAPAETPEIAPDSENSVNSEAAQEIQQEQELVPMAASAVVIDNDSGEIVSDKIAPVVASIAAVPIIASGSSRMAAGSAFNDLYDLDQDFVEKIQWAHGAHGADGEPRSVVRMSATIPEERQLDLSDFNGNMKKIDAVISPKAIIASGGYCAPLPVNYDIYGVGSNVRPVRDSLPTFGATRGGIAYIQPPKLGAYTSAIALWTAANDADPTSPATKPYLQITCASQLTATTNAVTLSLVFGNLMSRAYPELVQRHNQLALVQHARFAEQSLLNQIAASSTVTTTGYVAGTARDVLRAIAQAAAAYRNRNRVPRGVMLRAIMPEWVLDAMREDIAASTHFEDLAPTDQAITAWLAVRGINITWHMDESTFATQSSSAPLIGFPTTIKWWLFAEGTFLFLDGGILDLGVVRDSALINTNDYRTFVETFEGIAMVGIESLQVTTTIGIGLAPVLPATGYTVFAP